MSIKINFTSKMVPPYSIIKLVIIIIYLTLLFPQWIFTEILLYVNHYSKLCCFNNEQGRKHASTYVFLFLSGEYTEKVKKEVDIRWGCYSNNFYWVLMWQHLKNIVCIHNSIDFSELHCQVGNFILHIFQARRCTHIYIK